MVDSAIARMPMKSINRQMSANAFSCAINCAAKLCTTSAPSVTSIEAAMTAPNAHMNSQANGVSIA